MKKIIYSPDLGLLLFRLTIGLTISLAHGLGKIPPSEQFIGGVSALGFPLPILFAWMASLSEFLGGLLIALGLYIRHAAVFLGFTMSVAAFNAHASDPFAKKEMAILFLVSCVLLFFQGAGKFSLDRLVRKK